MVPSTSNTVDSLQICCTYLEYHIVIIIERANENSYISSLFLYPNYSIKKVVNFGVVIYVLIQHCVIYPFVSKCQHGIH